MNTTTKSLLSLIAGSLLLLIGACNTSSVDPSPSPDKVMLPSSVMVAPIDTQKEISDNYLDTKIDVNKEMFQKMVKFIKAHGTKIDGWDYQYVLFDSKGSRHAYVFINSENPAHQKIGEELDSLGQISVWAYKNGKKNRDVDNFVGYGIYKDRAEIFVPTDDPLDIELMSRGVIELGKKAL